jgi:plastocyanin
MAARLLLWALALEGVPPRFRARSAAARVAMASLVAALVAAAATPDGGEPAPAAVPPEKPQCVFKGKVTLTRGGAPISPKGRVVVYIDKVRGADEVASEVPVPIDQQDYQFNPQLKVLLRGSRVVFTNRDKQPHNVFVGRPPNHLRPGPLTSGDTRPETLAELGPTRVQCDIHGWMRADVLVVRNRYFSEVTSDDGSFTLPAAPASSPYTVVAWERNGGKVEVKGLTCIGDTEVKGLTLEQLPEPKLLHYDNSPYEGRYQQSNEAAYRKRVDFR